MVSEFDDNGTSEAAGAMQALEIAAGFAVIEAAGAGLGGGGEVTAVDQFQVEGAPEACMAALS